MLKEKSMNAPSFRLLLASLSFVWLGAGCADKAKPHYAECVQAKAAGRVEDAWKACNDAVLKDATSEAGKSAAHLLAEMKLAYDSVKMAREATEAKAAEESAKAATEARAARAKELRSRIQIKWVSADPSGDCAGRGLPPYWWQYTGGTYAEDAELAQADGCVTKTNFRGQDTDFCCPQRP